MNRAILRNEASYADRTGDYETNPICGKLLAFSDLQALCETSPRIGFVFSNSVEMVEWVRFCEWGRLIGAGFPAECGRSARVTRPAAYPHSLSGSSCWCAVPQCFG